MDSSIQEKSTIVGRALGFGTRQKSFLITAMSAGVAETVIRPILRISIVTIFGVGPNFYGKSRLKKVASTVEC